MSGLIEQIGLQPFDEEDVVSTYSDSEAIDDGVLVNLGEINPEWAKGLINIATTNLLTSKGYLLEEEGKDRITNKINIPNILDLLNQAARILKLKIKNDLKFNGETDHLYTKIMIEGPDGNKFEVWAGLNGQSQFTIMLPEDY